MNKTTFLLLIICALCACKSAPKTDDLAVPVKASVMHNPDSLAYYAELAYKHEDPKGLFVTAVAAYLRAQGTMPDSCTTVPLDEAEIMLLRSAELGYEDAKKAIRCLDAHGCWEHSLPE
jgi:hypothetical protein